MKLGNEVRQKNISWAEAGRQMGIPRSTLANYEAGRRIPNYRHMLKLYVWSDGRVDPNSFYPLPELAAAPAREAAE